MLTTIGIIHEGISGIEGEGDSAILDFGNGVKVGVGKEIFSCC
jgi:hypothetical protein